MIKNYMLLSILAQGTSGHRLTKFSGKFLGGLELRVSLTPDKEGAVVFVVEKSEHYQFITPPR